MSNLLLLANKLNQYNYHLTDPTNDGDRKFNMVLMSVVKEHPGVSKQIMT